VIALAGHKPHDELLAERAVAGVLGLNGHHDKGRAGLIKA
jgi:hypothetical protein